MSRFISERFSSIAPYVPGEQPQDKQYVKLNTNESPFPPSPKVVEALSKEEALKLNLYSDPTVKAFAEAVVSYYNRRLIAAGREGKLTCDNVLPVNGSDEALAFIFRAFTDANRGMACPEIGYGCYPVFCGIEGTRFKAVAMKDGFKVDVNGFRGVKDNITIANPNAQTGLYVSLFDIETLLSENCDRLVVIDEAYCDFGGESAVSLLDSYDNLIVVQTLSKSRQLAGARIGFALASKEIIEDLNKIKYSFNPYNVNRLSTIAGIKAMEDEEYFEKTRKQIIINREKTKEVLRGMGFEVTDSLANFVLASRNDIGGKELYLALKSKGVLVRFLSDEKLKNSIRITIGSQEQMELLFEKTAEVLKENNL